MSSLRAVPSGNHGTPRPTVSVMRRAPVLDDQLAASTADALRLSASGIKQLAAVGWVSGKSASRWRVEGRGNPLYNLTQIVYGLGRMGQFPGAIIAHLKAALAQAQMGLSDGDLRLRYRTSVEAMLDAQARAWRAAVVFAWEPDLEAVEKGAAEAAGYAEEVMACCRELRLRRIDPLNDETHRG